MYPFRKKRISPFCIRIFPYERYIIITEFVETLCFPVKPVKHSSPVPDELNNDKAPRPGLSKKAKLWIGLSLAVCIPLIVFVLLWLTYLALFPNNSRLVVNSIRLAGNSGYWSPADPDERQARLDRILSILRIRLGGTESGVLWGKDGHLGNDYEGEWCGFSGRTLSVFVVCGGYYC